MKYILWRETKTFINIELHFTHWNIHVESVRSLLTDIPVVVFILRMSQLLLCHSGTMIEFFISLTLILQVYTTFLYQFLSKPNLSQINPRKKRQCLQCIIYTYITSGSGSILWWKHVFISTFTFDRTTWVNQRNRNYRK